jgi:hypothetical protein
MNAKCQSGWKRREFIYKKKEKHDKEPEDTIHGHGQSWYQDFKEKKEKKRKEKKEKKKGQI